MAEEAMLESPTDAVVEPTEPSGNELDASLAELEKALNEGETPKGAAKPAVDATKPAPKPEDATKTPETPAPVDPLEEQLKAIEEPKVEEKPAEPQLTAEQKQVLEYFPTAAKATEVLNLAAGYQNFTGALASGDFANVETMIEKWNPEIAEAQREYFFDKFVRNGDWVDRWVAEREGRAEENKDVRTLKTQVNKLQSQLAQQKTVESTQAQQAYFNDTVSGFVKHVDGLLDTIKATDATDRKIIWSMVNADVSGNQALKQAIHNRDYKAVNKSFKEATRTYFTKNKAATVSREAQASAQAAHKAPIQAGAMQEIASTLPDDIKQVPKGQEDNWLDQQLGKLKKRAGIK